MLYSTVSINSDSFVKTDEWAKSDDSLHEKAKANGLTIKSFIFLYIPNQAKETGHCNDVIQSNRYFNQ